MSAQQPAAAVPLAYVAEVVQAQPDPGLGGLRGKCLSWPKGRVNFIVESAPGTRLYTKALASNAGVPELPQLDDEMRYILGMPNFQAGQIAQKLRDAGAKIERKSEHEQAFVIDWLLRLRIKHGPVKWHEVAATELQAAAPSPQAAQK